MRDRAKPRPLSRQGVLTALNGATTDRLVFGVNAPGTATALKALAIIDDAVPIWAYPETVRVRLRAAKGVERLNAEIWRSRGHPHRPRRRGPPALEDRVAGDPGAMGSGAVAN